MSIVSDEVEAVFNTGSRPAHMVTLRPDGRPHVTVVWTAVEDTARITEGGAPDLLQQLAQRYLGAGAKYPLPDEPPTGFITRITATKIGGVGPWR
jgi:hypothetical protein